MTKNIQGKLKKVKLIICDVDGVLTNGEIIVDSLGKELKIYDVKDGFALVLAKRMGIKTAVLSARKTPAVTHRAKDLKIDRVSQDASPKLPEYQKMLRSLKLKDGDACFIGDDLTDLSVLKHVGFAVTVPNGAPELRKHADYVTKNPGGKGAVREVVELILKAQKKWNTIVKQYESQ